MKSSLLSKKILKSDNLMEKETTIDLNMEYPDKLKDKILDQDYVYTAAHYAQSIYYKRVCVILR